MRSLKQPLSAILICVSPLLLACAEGQIVGGPELEEEGDDWLGLERRKKPHPRGGPNGAGGSSGSGSTAGAGGSGSTAGAGGSSGGTTDGGGATAGTGGSTSGGAGSGGSSAGGTTSSGGSSGSAGSGGSGNDGSGGAPVTADTFYVSGRDLYDRCGEKVILRGVNEMVVYSGGKDGVPEFSEITKTGANSVRIVWNSTGSASELDGVITNAVAEKLIPIIEHHGATGDLSKVPEVVDYWTRSDIVAVLKEHSPYLLLNIANEAGSTVSQDSFVSTYKTAISRIRGTGVKMPLVIDAPQWGQDIDMLQAAGPTLREYDPEHNTLFSVHMWWDDATGDRVKTELAQSVQMGLPLIVGEFAQHAVYRCDDAPFAYQVLLAEAQKHGIGWLAWSWGGISNADCAGQGSFDMTVNGVYGSWEEPWGGDVAVTNTNSIKNTSVRPQSMLNGSCD